MKNPKRICGYMLVCIICFFVCVIAQSINIKHAYKENDETTEKSIAKLQSEVNRFHPEINRSYQKFDAAKKKFNIDLSVKIIQPFQFPLDSKYRDSISSAQGLRTPISLPNSGGTISSKYHNALDIAVPDFTPVYAAKDGKVITVYPSYYNGGGNYRGHPQYGGLVEIMHSDGTKSLYAHLSMAVVHEGDTVIAGQKIGHSGGVAGRRGSGQSTGPHLHFEVILNINDMFIE